VICAFEKVESGPARARSAAYASGIRPPKRILKASLFGGRVSPTRRT
jgi:hypothetical protein